MSSTPTATPPASSTPAAGSPAAVTVPAVAVTWPKLLTLCGAILLAVGGGYLSLVSVIYGNLNDSIKAVDGRVAELRATVLGAAKDAGAFQTLVAEAPELRKNIQDTHDGVIRIGDRLDGIDRSLATLNASVAKVGGSTDRLSGQIDELQGRFSSLESAMKRGPDLK